MPSYWRVEGPRRGPFVLKSWTLTGGYWRFEVIFRFSLQSRSNPEDGGSNFLRNVSRPAEVPDYTVSHSRRHSVLIDISINNDLCFGGAVTVSAVGRGTRTAMQPLSANFMTVSFPVFPNFPVSFTIWLHFVSAMPACCCAPAKRQYACSANSFIHFSATSTLAEAIGVFHTQYNLFEMGRIHGRSQVSLSATMPRRMQLWIVLGSSNCKLYGQCW